MGIYKILRSRYSLILSYMYLCFHYQIITVYETFFKEVTRSTCDFG